jgi:hypothetical protein
MKLRQTIVNALLLSLITVALPAVGVAQQNSQPTIVGTLANFDVVNDLGEEAEGFEIQLEGLQASDVVSTFGQAGPSGLCYIRYCTPSIVPYATGVFVRWTNGYDAAAQKFVSSFNVPNMPLPTSGTPIPATANIVNLIAGHQCWSLGLGAAYPTSGCEHFGVGLIRTPTATTYRWLVGDPATGIISQFAGAPVAIAQPALAVVPAAPGLAPEVQAVINAPAPVAPAHRYGRAEWVKVYKTENAGRVDLDQLIIDGAGNVVPNKDNAVAETEWKLLQFDITNPDKGSSQLKSHGSPNGNSHSVIRRYEFFKYSGAVVAPGGTSGKKGAQLSTDDQEASRCPRDAAGECTEPAPGELGDFIGAQMAAANLAGDVVLINQTITFSLPASATAGDAPLSLTATGGDSGNPVTFAAVGPCSIAPGSSLLSFNGAGACFVTASQAGNASFAPAAPKTLIINVAPAAVSVIWSAPAPIVYGTPLGAAQLSATASAAGVLTFSPAAGTVLPAGTTTLTATFTPADPNARAVSATVSLSVLRAPLTVKADDKARSYGGANPALTASIRGFVNGDSDAVLSGSADLATSAGLSSPAGAYPISIAAGTLSAANYSFSLAGGTLVVTPAHLTVAAGDASRIYGSANPFFSASFSGFVLGEDSAVLAGSLAFSTPATQASGAGSYPISAFGVSSPNYDIHFANGTLTIQKATLFVTANGQQIDFGDPIPTLTSSITGFVLADDLTSISDSPLLSTTATASSAPGTYPILASAGTLSAANYQFAFVPGTLTITAPHAVLQSVRAGLASYRSTVDSSLGQRLDDAIGNLGRAVDASLWIDDSHPATNHGGGAVFDRTKDAVSKLLQAANAAIPANAGIQQAIARILRADRGLAVIAISDAQGRTADPSRIAKAQSLLAQADLDALQRRPDSSIGNDGSAFTEAATH